MKKFDFWKLLVYAKPYSDAGQYKEEICIQLETTRWVRNENSHHKWQRNDRKITPLKYWVCHLDAENEWHKETVHANTPTEHLFAQNGKIHFKQGRFLKIEVLSHLSGDSELVGFPRGDYRDYFSGRNIHAEVTFETNPNNENLTVSPLFYLEQGEDKHVLRFGEEYAPDEETPKTQRHIYWQISGGEKIKTGEFNITDEDSLEYTLTISQDRDRRLYNVGLNPMDDKVETLPVYFEFLADAVPLPMAVEGSANDETKTHAFQAGDRLLYIGYDPESKTTFEGTLERLLFDPNSSCEAC